MKSTLIPDSTPDPNGSKICQREPKSPVGRMASTDGFNEHRDAPGLWTLRSGGAQCLSLRSRGVPAVG